ncbi:Uncharacterised protein [Vibrio cholerae]|nr:Uncharacterised protein [Vibrio cholerae]
MHDGVTQLFALLTVDGQDGECSVNHGPSIRVWGCNAVNRVLMGGVIFILIAMWVYGHISGWAGELPMQRLLASTAFEGLHANLISPSDSRTVIEVPSL